MSAARKIDDAQKILNEMKFTGTNSNNITSFAQTVQESYDALLDEYSKKFGCKTGHTSLSKFKSNAKKLGKVGAIRFLIWYEREFRAIRSDPSTGFLLEAKTENLSKRDDILKSCSTLLERTRQLVYHAYENF